MDTKNKRVQIPNKMNIAEHLANMTPKMRMQLRRREIDQTNVTGESTYKYDSKFNI